MRSKFIKYIFLWVSLCLPIFVFEVIFRSQFEAYELTGGVYRDAPFIYIGLSLLLTIFYGFIPNRLRLLNWYRLVFVFVFCMFFIVMCTQVAWDYRMNFGTTWQWSEVFFELVAPQWYFYAIGFVGLLVHCLGQINYSKNLQIN